MSNTTTTQVVDAAPLPMYARPQVISIEIVASLLIGGIAAIGIPKLLNMYGAEKIEGVKSERRREDNVYSTLFASMDTMMKTLTQMTNTMAAGQSSSTSESFQLMSTLVQEISLMREVVSNNTIVMQEIRDTNEALTREIHEMRVAGCELRDEMSKLQEEVSILTRRV